MAHTLVRQDSSPDHLPSWEVCLQTHIVMSLLPAPAHDVQRMSSYHVAPLEKQQAQHVGMSCTLWSALHLSELILQH